eukprot:1027483-Prymnesium_polylepis.1
MTSTQKSRHRLVRYRQQRQQRRQHRQGRWRRLGATPREEQLRREAPPAVVRAAKLPSTVHAADVERLVTVPNVYEHRHAMVGLECGESECVECAVQQPTVESQVAPRDLCARRQRSIGTGSVRIQ